MQASIQTTITTMPPLTPRNTNASLASSNAKERKQAPEDSDDGGYIF